MQVVRAGPHVDGDQRPEVHDRQAVGVDRASGLLRHEVVHHPEEAGGQEEAHRVVAVPPLHHRVDGAAVDRVGVQQAAGQGQAVDDVQQRHGDDVGAEEPVGHVDVLDRALGDGAEEQHGVGHPDHRDQHVDRPDQLGVFLALGQAQRQRHRRGHDDQLPAPEHERRQLVRDQPNVAGPLHHVQAGGEQGAAAEREDHRVGVQRAQPAVAQPGQVEIQGRPVQLRGDQHPHQHPHDAPDHGHHRELAHHLVVASPLDALHAASPILVRWIFGSGPPGRIDQDQPPHPLAGGRGARRMPQGRTKGGATDGRPRP